MLDVYERSKSWTEEELRMADPIFLMLRARLLKREAAEAEEKEGIESAKTKSEELLKILESSMSWDEQTLSKCTASFLYLRDIYAKMKKGKK